MADNLKINTSVSSGATPPKSGDTPVDKESAKLARLLAEFKERSGITLSEQQLRGIVARLKAKVAQKEKTDQNRQAFEAKQGQHTVAAKTSGATNTDGVRSIRDGLTVKERESIKSDPKAGPKLPAAEADPITPEQAKTLLVAILAHFQIDDGPINFDDYMGSLTKRPPSQPRTTGGAPQPRTSKQSAPAPSVNLSFRTGGAGATPKKSSGDFYNAGGGIDCSTSFDGMNFNWNAFYASFLMFLVKDRNNFRKMMRELRRMHGDFEVLAKETNIEFSKLRYQFEKQQKHMKVFEARDKAQKDIEKGVSDAKAEGVLGANNEQLRRADQQLNNTMNTIRGVPDDANSLNSRQLSNLRTKNSQLANQYERDTSERNNILQEARGVNPPIEPPIGQNATSLTDAQLTNLESKNPALASRYNANRTSLNNTMNSARRELSPIQPPLLPPVLPGQKILSPNQLEQLRGTNPALATQYENNLHQRRGSVASNLGLMRQQQAMFERHANNLEREGKTNEANQYREQARALDAPINEHEETIGNELLRSSASPEQWNKVRDLRNGEFGIRARVNGHKATLDDLNRLKTIENELNDPNTSADRRTELTNEQNELRNRQRTVLENHGNDLDSAINNTDQNYRAGLYELDAIDRNMVEVRPQTDDTNETMAGQLHEADTEIAATQQRIDSLPANSPLRETLQEQLRDQFAARQHLVSRLSPEVITTRRENAQETLNDAREDLQKLEAKSPRNESKIAKQRQEVAQAQIQADMYSGANGLQTADQELLSAQNALRDFDTRKNISGTASEQQSQIARLSQSDQQERARLQNAVTRAHDQRNMLVGSTPPNTVLQRTRQLDTPQRNALYGNLNTLQQADTNAVQAQTEFDQAQTRLNQAQQSGDQSRMNTAQNEFNQARDRLNTANNERNQAYQNAPPGFANLRREQAQSDLNAAQSSRDHFLGGSSREQVSRTNASELNRLDNRVEQAQNTANLHNASGGNVSRDQELRDLEARANAGDKFNGSTDDLEDSLLYKIVEGAGKYTKQVAEEVYRGTVPHVGRAASGAIGEGARSRGEVDAMMRKHAAKTQGMINQLMDLLRMMRTR